MSTAGIRDEDRFCLNLESSPSQHMCIDLAPAHSTFTLVILKFFPSRSTFTLVILGYREPLLPEIHQLLRFTHELKFVKLKILINVGGSSVEKTHIRIYEFIFYFHTHSGIELSNKLYIMFP